MWRINNEMNPQQCFQDVEKKLTDLNSRSKQLLSWIDDLASAFKRSFMFDKYYFFLASLLTNMNSIVYAWYNEDRGEIALISLLDDSMVYLFLKDLAFASPPLIFSGLSTFFVDLLKQKVLEAIETYKAKIKRGQKIKFFFDPLDEYISIPAEFGDKPVKLSRNLEFEIREDSNNILGVFTPLKVTFGKGIEITVIGVNLSALDSLGIPLQLKKGSRTCETTYIGILPILEISRLMETCGYMVTEQDEPIVYQTLCEALNKVAEYGNYALDIIKRLTLKGGTVLTTALLY